MLLAQFVEHSAGCVRRIPRLFLHRLSIVLFLPFEIGAKNIASAVAASCP
jgi:hypothetical protein